MVWAELSTAVLSEGFGAPRIVGRGLQGDARRRAVRPRRGRVLETPVQLGTPKYAVAFTTPK